MLCFPFFFFYLFPHPIKIYFSLLSVPVLSWESINHLKVVRPRMNFFPHFGSHIPDSSPWTLMENVDIQRTGPVIRPGSSRGVCVCVCGRAQSCLTLCDSMDCNPPGSSVHGIFQAKILEWVVISSSGGSSWPKMELKSPALPGGIFTAESLVRQLSCCCCC